MRKLSFKAFTCIYVNIMAVKNGASNIFLFFYSIQDWGIVIKYGFQLPKQIKLFIYSKTCVKTATLKKTKKMVFKTDYIYILMLVKSIAECYIWHSAMLLAFIKLPVIIKTWYFQFI